jgi:phosphate uptake regulator
MVWSKRCRRPRGRPSGQRSSSKNVSKDIERVGDQAERIAKILD